MATTTEEYYVLIIWDCDCAPDGVGFGITRVFSADSADEVWALKFRHSRIEAFGTSLFHIVGDKARFVSGTGVHSTVYPK